MSKDICILIVEDDPLIAEDIAGFVLSAGYAVCGKAYNVTDAMKELNKGLADFVLLDINLNGEMSGIDIAHTINADFHIPFAYITSYSDATTLQKAKDTHPSGYLVKPFNEKDIFASIVIGIENFYHNRETNTGFTLENINKLCTDPLSQKEWEAIQKLAQGKSNKMMANELFVSVNTIKTHLKSVFLKLQVRSRAELISLIGNLR